MQQQVTRKMSKASPRGGLGDFVNAAFAGVVAGNQIAGLVTNPFDTIMNTNQASTSQIANIGPSVPLFDSNGNVIPGTGLVNTGQAVASMFSDSPGGNAISGATNIYNIGSDLSNGILPSADSFDWQGIATIAVVGLVGYLAFKALVTFK